MRKRKRLFILVGLVAMAVTVLGYVLLTPADSLLAKATRIADVKDWKLSSHVWLNDHAVMAVRYDTSEQYRPDYAVRVDTGSGEEKRFTLLDEKLAAKARTGRCFCVSPDGKWLLWLAKGSEGHVWVAAALDGSGRVVERPLEPPPMPTTDKRLRKGEQRSGQQEYLIWRRGKEPDLTAAWLRDSSGWIATDAPTGLTRIRVHSLDTKVLVREKKVMITLQLGSNSYQISTAYLVTPEGGRISPPTGMVHQAVGLDLTMLGVDASGRAIGYGDIVGNGAAFHTVPPTKNALYRIDMAETGLAEALPPPTFPPNTRIDQVALSPKGDKVAWKLFLHRDQNAVNWLTRLFPFLRRNGTRTTAEIWVSDVEGANLHEIGSILVRPQPFLLSRDFPNQLRWTPDGKRVSLVYQKVLYTVPVD